jgi:(1->4)-alpha-D-glucan 1-alpha-D-glucosylmutase
MVNSLAQTLIKITAPGVPDFYQGTELWDFSLVDPDNRRPVDFASRAALLDELRARIAAGDLPRLARELVEQWPDGRIKLYTIHRALTYRRGTPDLLRMGDYVPLQTGGRAAEHVCAFARRGAMRTIVTVVPRLTARLTDNGARLPLGADVWGDTRVVVPRDLPDGPYVNLFTGEEVRSGDRNGSPVLAIEDLLAEFPVALLASAPSPSMALA